ncbi:MAG: DUF2784 family protein [Brachymonas sp.]|nr:DUF2784 family protein [Brachymonas sp.]
MKKSVYPFLNAAFHALHIAVIMFFLLGWLVPALLPWHLTLLLAMLGSWFILGHWLGTGYCPISDWHWKIKQHCGPGKPDGSYIHLVLQHITGKTLNSARVDKWVLVITLFLTLGSLLLNARNLFLAE